METRRSPPLRPRPKLLLLADSGGSNSCTSWAWKIELQSQLCNRFGLAVTIAHYPTGASKWNPIEHRLFSEISKNWAAEPLDSYEKMLKFIRTTSTQTGLVVTAYLDRNEYPTRLKPDPQLISIAGGCFRRRTYRGLVRVSLADSGVRGLAYCLMPNHVHWVMMPERHFRFTRSLDPWLRGANRDLAGGGHRSGGGFEAFFGVGGRALGCFEAAMVDDQAEDFRI